MANNTTNGDSNRRVFDLMKLLTQEEDPFFEPTSTAVADKPVREREEPIAEDYGSISEDPRSFIQRKADEIYESGPAGAALAAIADILPGIPFVDIIDPPEQLSDPSSQTARNLLGAVGLVSGFAKTPQAVGRVATNVREPWSYGGSIEKLKQAINRFDRVEKRYDVPGQVSGWRNVPIKEKIKEVVQAVVKDKPLYGRLDPRREKYLVEWQRRDQKTDSQASMDAREFLYRKMFGLKPRAGKNIFVEHADGTLSFNPKSKRARKLLREIIINPKVDASLGWGPGPRHSVMGGYTRTPIQKMRKSELKPFKTSHHIVDYEDIWDFKMNPSDWSSILAGFKESPKQAVMGSGYAAIRSLAHMITNPPHIKGRLAMDKFGEFVGQRGPDPKVMEDFVRMMATD
jgi:hypothetical protein